MFFGAKPRIKSFKVLEDNNILATNVPPNVTHLFQSLDLTVNRVAKAFTKKKFLEWFSKQISIGLENGQELEDIEIDHRLKCLEAPACNVADILLWFISSPEGKAVITSGWKKSGIFDAVELGLSKLPVLDQFSDIYPLMEIIPPKETLSLASLFPQELESYKTKVADEIDENESEWEVDT